MTPHDGGSTSGFRWWGTNTTCPPVVPSWLTVGPKRSRSEPLPPGERGLHSTQGWEWGRVPHPFSSSGKEPRGSPQHGGKRRGGRHRPQSEPPRGPVTRSDLLPPAGVGEKRY